MNKFKKIAELKKKCRFSKKVLNRCKQGEAHLSEMRSIAESLGNLNLLSPRIRIDSLIDPEASIVEVIKALLDSELARFERKIENLDATISNWNRECCELKDELEGERIDDYFSGYEVPDAIV